MVRPSWFHLVMIFLFAVSEGTTATFLRNKRTTYKTTIITDRKSTQVPEGEEAHLSCSSGKIEIEIAEYSNWLFTAILGAEYSKQVVRRKCDGYINCKIRADFFSNDGVKFQGLHFRVDYKCIQDCRPMPHCHQTECTSISDVRCRVCNNGVLLYKLLNGECRDKCSWKNRLCWPGKCNGDFAHGCQCKGSFRLRNTPGETSCQPTMSPSMVTCRMRIIGDGGNMADSKTVGSTECKNQQDFYGNFQVHNATISMKSDFIMNVTSSAYPKPRFVGSFMFGVTDGLIKVLKRDVHTSSPAIQLETVTLKPDDGSYPSPVFSSDNRNIFFSTVLKDGDRLCIEFMAKGGGYVMGKDLTSNLRTESKFLYDKTTITREICYYYDISPPIHCSENARCSDEPMYISERITEGYTVEVMFSGWLDPIPKGGRSSHASGVSTTEVTINEMRLYGNILSTGNKITSFGINSSATFTLPRSPTPVLYEVLLEVKDVAGNVRHARRFVLQDNSSKVEMNSNKRLFATSADTKTDFLWQTNLREVCFSWKDLFLNKQYMNGNFLNQIKPKDDINGIYDQINGLLPISGTKNVNGITENNYRLSRNNKTLLYGDVPEFNNESICLSPKIADGDKFLFEVTAKDLVDHTMSTECELFVDSTVPNIDQVFLSKDGEKRLYAHSDIDLSTMKLTFHAFDTHSGIHEVLWSLRASEEKRLLGSGALAVIRLSNNTTCPVSSTSCYCPILGPCEYSNYTVDLNQLIVNNTHIGNHNRKYIFSLRITNNALLSDIEHIDILVDDSPPETGVVKEGPSDGPDIDYTSEDSIIANWLGFIDHESGIRKYIIAIGPHCMAKEQLLSPKKSDEFFITSTVHNDARLPLANNSKSFVSVVALNNALDASDVACSDGISTRTASPLVKNLTILWARTANTIACLNTDPWLITEELYRIKLLNTSGCLQLCNGLQENEYFEFLTVIGEAGETENAEFFCKHQTIKNIAIIYLPDNKMDIRWKIPDDGNQIEEIAIGIGSQKSRKEDPDLLSYEKVNHPEMFKKHHTGLTNGEEIYIFLKVLGKSGMSTVIPIGPVLIDETPPTCPSSIPVEVINNAVVVKWSNTTFTDKQQKEQIDSLFFKIVSEKGQGTPFHEWSLSDSRRLCTDHDRECISYPLKRLQSIDSESGLEFEIHFKVYNKAGHFCDFRSAKFKVPSIFDPGQALVLDLDPDKTFIGEEEDDTDATFNTSAICIHYSGLREHADLKLRIGLGTEAGGDDVVSYREVNRGKNEDMLCLQNLSLAVGIQYFSCLKAVCSGGVSISSSDGFFLIDNEFIQKSVSVYEGFSCSGDNRENYDSIYFPRNGSASFERPLHVGIHYRLSSRNLNVSFMSKDVIIRKRDRGLLYFVPMTPNPKFAIDSEEDADESDVYTELHTCNDDLNFIHANASVPIHWSIRGLINNITLNLKVGLQRQTINGSFVGVIEHSLKKTFNITIRKQLESGYYRSYVIPCFGSTCGTPVYSNGFTVVRNLPITGSIESSVVLFQNQTSRLTAEWKKFQCVAPNDTVLFYRYGLFKDSEGSIPLSEIRILPVSDISSPQTLHVIESFTQILKPYQEFFFCVDGFCESTLSNKQCSQIEKRVIYNYLDTSYIFEVGRSPAYENNAVTLATSKPVGIIGKLNQLENLDIDFVRPFEKVSCFLAPSSTGNFTWFIMKHRRLPIVNCNEDEGCLFAKVSTSPMIDLIVNDNMRNGQVYFVCVTENAKKFDTGNVSKVHQNKGLCSDGFKIDDEKPIAGFVEIISSNGFLSENNEIFVSWHGFKDVEQNTDSTLHRNRISHFQLAIGTKPFGQDVLSYTNTGLSTTFIAKNITLTSGLAYFATVKAYDMTKHEAVAVSKGVIVDVTPPTLGKITVGHSRGHRSIVGGDIFQIHWSGFSDRESDIKMIEYAIGTSRYSDDVFPYTKISGATFTEVRISGILKQGRGYYVSLIATNNAGLFTTTCSEKFLVDNTPPQGGVVRDGSADLKHDLDYQINSTTMSVHWAWFSDPESGIKYYRVGLGSSPESANVFSLHQVGKLTSWTWHSTFSQGSKYYAIVEACNHADLCTKVTSNGVTIDASPPIPGIVRIGSLSHHSKYTSKRTSVQATWTGFQDPHSGLSHFEICIGRNDSTCDIVPITNVLLTDSHTLTGLNLPIMTPLYFMVRAYNNVNMMAMSLSDTFFVDTTAPVFQIAPFFSNCKDAIKIEYQTDPSFLCLEWNATDDESPILSQTIKYSTHNGGHVPVQHSFLRGLQGHHLVLKPEDWLHSGDIYSASVTVCNAADLCTSSHAGRLVIDSTPPYVGGVKPPMNWSCMNKTCNINVTWYGFLDIESTIEKFYITVGKTYSGSEYVKELQVPVRTGTTDVYYSSLPLSGHIAEGDKLVLSVWAVNKAKLRSSIAKVSVLVQSTDKAGSRGNLVLEKHSCDIHYCNNDCTCAVVGEKCLSDQPSKCHSEQPVINSDITFTFPNVIMFKNIQVLSSGSCIAASWSSTNDSLRYEWSLGIEGEPPGSGIFDLLVEPVWYDSGLLNNVTHCTRRGSYLRHGNSYVFYLREWKSKNSFIQYKSGPILVDLTPPSIGRGKFIVESVGSCDHDLEFATDPTSLTACWNNVFTDQQSGIRRYMVSLGTSPDSDDVIRLTYVGLLRKVEWSGLSLFPGTKYYVTVVAENNVGLTTVAFSDGVVIDYERPLNGTVYNTRIYQNRHAQSGKHGISASWYGFIDKHSFIKYYFVGLAEYDHKADVFNNSDFKNVGLTTEYNFLDTELEHNHHYCVAVKAEDAAGYESFLSVSPPLLIDKTPPEQFKCTQYLEANFTQTNVSQTVEELVIKGSVSLVQDKGYKLQIKFKNESEDVEAEFSVSHLSLPIPLHMNQDKHMHGEYSFLAPESGTMEITLTVRHPGFVDNASMTYQILECTRSHLSTDDYSSTIEVRQVSFDTIGIDVKVVDQETEIHNISMSIGTSRGGNQIRPWSAAGLIRHLLVPIDVIHRSPIFVTAVIENTAGLRSYAFSEGIIMDHTEPVISDGRVELHTTKDDNNTMTIVSAKWEVHDDECGVDYCKLAIGSIVGADDLVEWTVLPGCATTYQSGYLHLVHGIRVHVTVRCVNKIGMWKEYSIEEDIVSYEKPKMDAIYASYIDGSGPTDTLPTELGTTNITAYWTDFEDTSGIREYRRRILENNLMKKPWASVGLRTFQTVLLENPDEGGTLSTEVRAVNKGEVFSNTLNITIIANSQASRLTGLPCKIESLSPTQHHLSWSDVYERGVDITYTVNVGTSEGLSDVIRNLHTKQTSTLLNAVETNEVFVAIDAVHSSGLHSYYRDIIRLI